ncbi:MarR family transcriptional regulator [Maritalea sp.]|uniref:MarR family transcriptional regulator n=1 Tax=Maritalea sp. TaxID=2003361 RepID=UPI003EF6F6BC
MNIADHLETLHRQAHRHWMKHGSTLGLSYSEFEYLSAIKEQEVLSTADDFHGQHLHDLVTAMGVNKASASAMMDKLEKRKLVRVKPCKRDARAKHFILSKSGEALRVQGKAAYAQLLETLSADVLAMISSQSLEAKITPNQAIEKPASKPKPKKKAEKPAVDNAELPQLSLFG